MDRYVDQGGVPVLQQVVALAGGGILALKTVLKTADYQYTKADSLARFDASEGSLTGTLPPAADTYDAITETGQVFAIKKVDAGSKTVTLKGFDDELIDGANTLELINQNDTAAAQSNGTTYDIIFRSQ